MHVDTRLFVKIDDDSFVEIRSSVSLLCQNGLLLSNDDVLEAIDILSSKRRALDDLMTILLIQHKWSE